MHFYIEGCVDGDVKLTRDNFPQIYWNRQWKYICPFQFTDNEYGAELFCNKLGLHSGKIKRASPEETKKYITRKYYETFLLGSCGINDIWPKCKVSCSIDHLGRGCFFKIHEVTKTKYYVCRKEQSWLYFLYCNGTTELPSSSCHGNNY